MNSFLGVHGPVKLGIASIKKTPKLCGGYRWLSPPKRGLAQVSPGSQKPVTEANHGALRAMRKTLGWANSYLNHKSPSKPWTQIRCGIVITIHHTRK